MEGSGVIILLIIVLSVIKASPSFSEKVFGGLFDIVYDSIAGLFKKIFRILIKLIKKEKLLEAIRKIYYPKKQTEISAAVEICNIQCPCCGCFTIRNDNEIVVNICGICGWQYSSKEKKHPDIITGLNNISLNEARKNYKKYKVSDVKFLENNWLREPLADELPKRDI
jgi:hypothetical protein